MNEPRPHLNETDPDDTMTKKSLKELKVISCANKMHLPSCGSIVGLVIKHTLLDNSTLVIS